jgi:DNA-3-methyladenine glycosylase I
MDRPAAAAGWYVYIVQCADRSLYTGVAKDVAARVATHNKGAGAKYTRSRKPVTVVYTEAAADRGAALRREYAIKQLQSAQKRTLIAKGPPKAAAMPKGRAKKEVSRCGWAVTPLGIAYHDAEWGVPVHDDRVFFEFLTLEGAQAGLSWETILKKRDGYRRSFADFDPQKVSRFTPARLARLMLDPGIVRNRLKLASTVTNAKAFLAVQREFGSFDAYVWRFVGDTPKVNHRRSRQGVPARTPESDALSRDLLKRGFRFVGSTICYAFMQATGLVDDHTAGCFRAARRNARGAQRGRA